MKASGSKHKRGAGVASPHESVAFLPSGPHACLPCVRCHLIRATEVLAFGSLCLPLSCYLIRDFMSSFPPPRIPSALLIFFLCPSSNSPAPLPYSPVSRSLSVHLFVPLAFPYPCRCLHFDVAFLVHSPCIFSFRLFHTLSFYTALSWALPASFSHPHACSHVHDQSFGGCGTYL